MKFYRQSNRKRASQSKSDFGEAKRPTIEDLNNVNYQDIYGGWVKCIGIAEFQLSLR